MHWGCFKGALLLQATPQLGPDAGSLYDQVLLYSGPATSDENEIFSFDAPVAGFSVQACNSAGCSGFSSNVFPW